MFRRFAYSLSRFMAGRNGMDYFGYCLWWFYLILLVIEVIVSLFSRIAGAVLSVLLWILFFYMLFRMLSRNLPARSRENLWWGKFWSKTPFGRRGGSRFGGGYGPGGYGQGGYGPGYGYNPGGYGAGNPGGNFYGSDGASGPSGAAQGGKKPKKKKVKLPRDKDHVYRICPSCKANIHLPKKKGAHTVRCPRCNVLFEVKI